MKRGLSSSAVGVQDKFWSGLLTPHQLLLEARLLYACGSQGQNGVRRQCFLQACVDEATRQALGNCRHFGLSCNGGVWVVQPVDEPGISVAKVLNQVMTSAAPNVWYTAVSIVGAQELLSKELGEWRQSSSDSWLLLANSSSGENYGPPSALVIRFTAGSSACRRHQACKLQVRCFHCAAWSALDLFSAPERPTAPVLHATQPCEPRSCPPELVLSLQAMGFPLWSTDSQHGIKLAHDVPGGVPSGFPSGFPTSSVAIRARVPSKFPSGFPTSSIATLQESHEASQLQALQPVQESQQAPQLQTLQPVQEKLQSSRGNVSSGDCHEPGNDAWTGISPEGDLEQEIRDLEVEGKWY